MEDQTLIALAILLFLATSWFVLCHAKRKTSLFILLLSIVSFGMGSASVALLPIDLSYASTALSHSTDGNAAGDADAETGDPYHNNPTYLPWIVTYWTTFFLAWLVLPIARQSLLSGHFTLRQRLRDGLRRSFRLISLMAAMGAVAVIAMAIHMRSANVAIVLPVLMAMANTYGLVLVAFFLGNGLVNIPKKLWREACPAKELRRTRIMAPIFEEELFEAVMGLEDVEDKIEEVCRVAVSLREEGEEGGMKNEEGGVALGAQTVGRRTTRCGACCRVDHVSEFHQCLEVLVRHKNETVDLCAERRTPPDTRRQTQNGARNGAAGDNGDLATLDHLVALHRQLKQAQERATSAQLRWNQLMEHSRLFSALMDDGAEDDAAAAAGEATDGTAALLLSARPRCCPALRYALQRLWVRCLRYPAYRAAALVTLGLSASVLLGEVTLSAPLNLAPCSWVLHALDRYHEYGTSGWAPVAFQVSALIPLLYMSLCVYTSLFQMSLLGPYCLRGNRQSAGVALVFNAQYLVRLQFPLGYNYLLMLKYDMTHCAFSNIMSDMATIPFLGTSFGVYAPLLILAVCLFTLLDFYPKILRLLGVDHEDALLLGDEEELDGKVNEGIQLMKRDAERRGALTTPEKQSLNGQTENIV